MSQRERKRLARSGQAQVSLHFLGATRTVTGSLHFFEYTQNGETTRFFLDMGLNQETESANHQNRLPAGIKAGDVQFGIFSHAHIDHTGFFPKLFKDGFRGKVYCTPATLDLVSLLLPDSGYLQEEEARRATKRAGRKETTEKLAGKTTALRKQSKQAESKTRVVEPLYTEQEARDCLVALQAVEYDQVVDVAPGIRLKLTNAAHILGAAVVTLDLGTGSRKRTVVFSGDLGRPNMPILQDVAAVKRADYVICEGTYGDRRHQQRNRQAILAQHINAAYERASKPHKKYGHGMIVIPAFAVGRVQSVLYDLRCLMEQKQIPEIPVFVDSPMAIRATAIYRSYKHLYNKQSAAFVAKGNDLFRTPRYAELLEYQMSMRLQEPASEPIIVVGSSGMATGGRIMQHLENRLPGEQNTVLFIGYQGQGTLGRQLLDPAVETVRIAGNDVRVRATVLQMEDYSGHGDSADIVAWLGKLQSKPKRVFLVHGDEESLTALQETLETQLRFDVTIPRYREVFALD
jgi:metallo-beta-lactamase family protein